MKTLILLALVLGIPVAAMGANPTLTNFNARHFIVDPLALPTNVITLHLNSEQFDTGGSDITITNVFGPGTTNIFQTFITTNITAVTEYVTNLYVTYLVSSNSISGNIQGTPPHLSMFFPDNFSLSDSIVTQNADTNGVTVNGTGDGSVTLGPTPDSITLAKNGTKLLFAFEPTGTNGIYNFGPDGSVLFNGPLTSELQLNTSLSGTFVDIFSGPSDGAAGGSYFHIQDDNNGIPFLLTQLSPYNNGGSAPYVFDTYTNISAGNLLESKNQTTNLFAISFDGKILVGGSATNLLYRDGRTLNYTYDPTGVLNGFAWTWDNTLKPQFILSESGSANQTVLGQASGIGTLSSPMLEFFSTTAMVALTPQFRFTRNGGGAYPTVYVDGFIGGVNDYARLAVTHTGTNGYILLSSQSNGTAGAARPLAVDRNLGAIITTGSDTVVDLLDPTQTNSVTGDAVISHATNGMDRVQFGVLRRYLNSSGANHTITLPAAWANPDGSSFTVTNNGIVHLFLQSWGDTSSGVLQSNVNSMIKFIK